MTVYYVDSTRPDDTGAGTSWATSKQTVQAGLNLLTVGGDQLWIGSNAPHIPSATLTWPATSVSNLTPLSIQGRNPSDDSPAMADINMNGGAFTSFTGTRLHTVYRNLEIHNNTGVNGILSFSAASSVKVIDCKIHDSNAAGAHGITVGAMAEIINTHIYDIQGIGIVSGAAGVWSAHGCLLHTITGNAIQTSSVSARITHCRFRNNLDRNILVNNDDTIIAFNSIVGTDTAGRNGIHYNAGSDGGMCIGNIIQDCDVGIEYNTTGGPTIVGYNVFHSNVGSDEANKPTGIYDLGSQSADPQFADVANDDFTIGNTALREQLFDIALHYGASQFGGVGAAAGGRRRRLNYLY